VTHLENVHRGKRGNVTHCPQGHEYTPENTRTMMARGKPARYCRICLTASKHRTYLASKAA
jgi:hypothetical protein